MAITRRTLLGGALTAAATAGTGLSLTSCSSNGTAQEATQASDDLLPVFKDASVVKPDLVSKSKEGLAGYLKYPAENPRIFDAPPLEGGSITSLTWTFDPVAPPLEKNPLWQNVNRSIGAEIDVVYTPIADYPARFQTVVAGGDLPDTVGIRWPAPQLPQLLKAQFADLTPHLSGDNVLKYRNLAGIPTATWRAATINGEIRTVPIPRPPINLVTYIRADVFEERGLPVHPKTFAELAEVMVELTDRRAGEWAAGDIAYAHAFVMASLGYPNLWTQRKGKFTFNAELPEYEEAIGRTKELYDKGVFHPDSLSAQNTQRNQWLNNGKIAMNFSGFVGWNKLAAAGAATKGFRLDAMLPVDYDSSTPARHAQGGTFATLTALKKADKSRIEEILKYLDWLASPFGSHEHLTRLYGVEGQTYELEGTDPIWTSAGQNQQLVPFDYVADATFPLYDPGKPETTRARFDYQERALPMIEPDPTAGLYSPTDAQKSQKLLLELTDTRNQIVQGRKPASAWKDAVTKWKRGGGDAIRAEYEKAFETVKS